MFYCQYMVTAWRETKILQQTSKRPVTTSTATKRWELFEWVALSYKGPTPASFCLFSFFSNTNFTEKTVGVSRIRTLIIGVEGEHTDPLTATTA